MLHSSERCYCSLLCTVRSTDPLSHTDGHQSARHERSGACPARFELLFLPTRSLSDLVACTDATCPLSASTDSTQHHIAPPRRFFLLFFLDLSAVLPSLPSKMPRDVGLWDLPDAVLRKICEQFCPHCDGEDCLGSLALPDCFWGSELLGSLDALMMVNVRISRIAQQVRFHVFCGRRNSLSLLVRTLVESPALAEHVRVVRLGDQVFDGDARCVLRELASPHHVEKLKFFAFPEADVDLDFMSASGEKRLLAKFLNLPEIEDSFCWTSRTVDTAACTVRVSVSYVQLRGGPALIVLKYLPDTVV